MARFGQGFLNALTQPSYGQGLFQLGGAIGGAPAANAERQAKQGVMALVNEALASNDPTQLLKAAQAISPIDPQTAVKLAGMANTARQEKKQAQMTALEDAGAGITRQAQRARAIQMAREAKDVPGLRQITSGSIEPAEYINSLADRMRQSEVSDVTYAIKPEVDTKTGSTVNIRYGFDGQGNVVSKTPLGVSSLPEKEEGEKSLAQLMKEAGMENVNLTTLEGAQEARRFALTEVSNPALANSIGQIVDELTPASLSETAANIRDLKPEYAQAEELLETTGRYRALNELGDEDVAGLSALLERTLTSTTENDLKAASELARFRSSADMIQRFKDFTNMTFTGKLSRETRKEYLQIIDALEALSINRMQKTLDTAILNAGEREAQELLRLRNFVLGTNSARIITE
jgi:hypothetical protein